MANEIKTNNILEILGLQEDQIFTVGINDRRFRFHKGCRQIWNHYTSSWDSFNDETPLIEIINNPHLINRKTKLTEKEIEICNLFDAMYVYRPDKGCRNVFLYKDPPVMEDGVVKESAEIARGNLIATVWDKYIFNEVLPGEVIKVR